MLLLYIAEGEAKILTKLFKGSFISLRAQLISQGLVYFIKGSIAGELYEFDDVKFIVKKRGCNSIMAFSVLVVLGLIGFVAFVIVAGIIILVVSNK